MINEGKGRIGSKLTLERNGGICGGNLERNSRQQQLAAAVGSSNWQQQLAAAVGSSSWQQQLAAAVGSSWQQQ